MKRTQTKQIKVGSLLIGGKNDVIIQSMCNTRTKDIDKTVTQIKNLNMLGCNLIRLAVMDKDDALAIKEIKSLTNTNLVADIHFDYKLAILAIESGVDKVRINPGNIGNKENVEKVVMKCKEYNVPIRIGINCGSLEKNIEAKYGKTAVGMIESAKEHIKILTDLNFDNIILSFKASDPLLCIEAYRLASNAFNYPLHLGVTEAGTYISSAIKSSFALGVLLNEGIGDTIRISVNGDPCNEITIAKQLLKANNLIKNVPNLIACPTCGRTQFDITPLVNEIEQFLMNINCDITVAIMGCAVNGPGEAKEADIAIAGGKSEGLLIKKGIIVEKIKQEDMLPRLKEEILCMQEQMKSR